MSKQWEHPVGVERNKLMFAMAYLCEKYRGRDVSRAEVLKTMRELGSDIDRATAYRWIAAMKEARIRAGVAVGATTEA